VIYSQQLFCHARIFVTLRECLLHAYCVPLLGKLLKLYSQLLQYITAQMFRIKVVLLRRNLFEKIKFQWRPVNSSDFFQWYVMVSIAISLLMIYLTIRKRENILTSLVAARNYNSVQHVYLNYILNIYGYLKTACFFGSRYRLQNKTLSLKYALLIMQHFSFNTFSMMQRNTADYSSDHSATSNAVSDVYLTECHSTASPVSQNYHNTNHDQLKGLSRLCENPVTKF
jgi:hypothetical protein